MTRKVYFWGNIKTYGVIHGLVLSVKNLIF